MTIAPDGTTVKRALSAHAAIGLLTGALLYIVCLSGTLLVFYEEWQWFEQATPPGLPFSYLIAQLDGQDVAGLGGPAGPTGTLFQPCPSRAQAASVSGCASPNQSGGCGC